MNPVKIIKLIVFALAVLAGMAYPASKIIRFEFPGQPPAVYRFRTGIVDPFDPFRGRYVVLRPLPSEVQIPNKGFDPKYAVLGLDEKGLATVTDLTEAPVKGRDCVRLESAYFQNWNKEKPSYGITLPFDRFYLNEELAPEAEKAFNEAIRKGDDVCVIKVNIYQNGDYAIEDLEIEGMPIHQYLKQSTRKE
jgi:hypothetical protein